LADITMPQLGETVTEGTITRWMKQVGQQVAEDEVLFEVSTDKVDSEVPSPVSGYLSEILVPEGDTVDVGTKLAVISSEAPAGGSANGGGGGSAGAEASTEPPATPAPAPPAQPAPAAPAPAQAATPSEPQPTETEAQPAAASAAPAEDIDEPQPQPAAAAAGRPTSGGPAGAGGTRPADDRPPNRPADGGGSGKVLSPVVRRLIAEHGLDPAQIEGSGAGGRITRADVLAIIDQQSAAPSGGNGSGAVASAPAPAAPAPAAPASAPAAAAPAPAATKAAPVPTVAAGDRDTIVPFTNIRRRTAEHMVMSKRTSAHTVVAMEVDYSAVEKVRRAQRERFKEAEGFGLTYLPFIARAVIDAIEEWPHINASVGDDQLIVHNYVNLGIAVDLNFEGLLVPVIHDADGKRLRAIAREISALAGRARSKKLTMDDISGGTFTITNAGPFGTLFTIPVINQPQVAILATDGVRKKPVVVELPDGTDSIAVHPLGNLVLSFDHRAFDGAYASAFMGTVKEILETRDWSAEL
jgi:2-oxoglutarate dehydrogenase E2 component (dihydrolipoamide succinyltransferase)